LTATFFPILTLSSSSSVRPITISDLELFWILNISAPFDTSCHKSTFTLATVPDMGAKIDNFARSLTASLYAIWVSAIWLLRDFRLTVLFFLALL
jgi:hypothetical protein